MEITFLIGNGFDIGLRLKTRFKDFFPIYKKNSLSKPDSIRQLSEAISEDIETWADFEYQIGQYASRFTSATRRDYIRQIEDFETEFTSYLSEQVAKLDWNESSRDFAKNRVKQALLAFYSRANLTTKSNMVLRRYMEDTRQGQIVFNFVNFNYTDTLDSILESFENNEVATIKTNGYSRTYSIGSIIHIHGLCGDTPIIGVNDESQIDNADLRKDKRLVRSLSKPLLNDALGNERDNMAKDMLFRSSIICIYGMSLGKTDKIWWQRIFSWLKNDTNRQLVIFTYDEMFSSVSQFKQVDAEDAIIDTLSLYVKEKSLSAEDFRDRIHISINKCIFSMQIPFKSAVDEYLAVLPS